MSIMFPDNEEADCAEGSEYAALRIAVIAGLTIFALAALGAWHLIRGII